MLLLHKALYSCCNVTCHQEQLGGYFRQLLEPNNRPSKVPSAGKAAEGWEGGKEGAEWAGDGVE